jgi:hypothetical protein
VEEDALQVKYDSTDFTESTNGLYLGASPTMTGSPVIGTALLADAQDGAALGSSSLQFSDLYLADGALIDLGDDGDVTITHVADSGIKFASAAPDITMEDETAGDGTANIAFTSGTASADIVATLQVDVSNTAVTYVTLDGTNERVTVGPTPNDNNIPFVIQGDADSDAGDDTADLLSITLTGNATSTAATWGFTSTQSAGYTFDKTITPSASNGAALGTDALDFADIFLATGAVINLGSGDVTLTHAANTLAFAGATSSYTFDDAVDITGSEGLILENDETLTNASDGTVATSGDFSIVGGDLVFGNITARIGGGTEDSITFNTDGTGDGEIVLENDSIGDDEIDWEGLTASHIFASPGITLTADSTLTDATPLLTLQDSNDAAGEGRIAAISSGGDNDVIFYLATEISTVTTDFVELDGVSETVDLLKNVVLSGTLSDGTATLNSGALSGVSTLGMTDDERWYCHA